ncbi:unnamed protein product, partial [Timema podura]|nr:unnamed protein product [Timema podura]
YSFVTPLTSLVVVKPNETTSVDTEKGYMASAPDFNYYKSSLRTGSSLMSAGVYLNAFGGILNNTY